MGDFSFALITMSYAADFEGCQILCRTVGQFVPPDVTHYLIVDQRDIPLFKQFNNARTQILSVESLLPWWVMRIPWARRWWLSLATTPIRNWILQQIIKLSLAQQIKEDVLIFADSDVAFIKTLNLDLFVKEGKVRLFRIPGGGDIPSHYKWHLTAGRLLGIPPKNYYGARYIGNLISWRRDHVLKLYQRIEETAHASWFKTLCKQWNLSEYVLYGVFVDCVLGEQNSGHFYDSKNICLEYWLAEPMTQAQEEEWLSKLTQDHVAIMINAKAKMKPEQFNRLLETCQHKAQHEFL